MDRKGIIAVTIALATLLVWQWYAVRTMPPKQQVPVAQVPSATPAPTPVAPTPAPLPSSTEPQQTEQTFDYKSPSVELAFSSLGGGISKATLLKHAGENGEKIVLNKFGHLPIGAVAQIPGEAAAVPYTLSVDETKGEVLLQRTTADQLQIQKKFILPKAGAGKDQYLVKMELTIANLGEQPVSWPGYYLHLGSASPVHKRDLPIYTGFTYYRNGKDRFIDVNQFAAGRVPLIGIQTRAERKAIQEPADQTTWTAVKNQYFATLLSPVGAPAGNSIWAQRFEIPTGDKPLYGIEGALGMPAFTLPTKGSMTQQFEIYIGPKEFGLLSKLGGNKDRVMNFGMFRIVSETLLASMNWLHSFLGNYAAAIFVLTIAIKSAMWPIQNKATSSMKQMQLLQPRMNELREKYKDDPTRMNQELMKLYKDYGVNPFSGCLPMLVQIPIFFGFYSMLGTAVELRNSKFLWVQDLSQPDTVFHLAGIPVNVLPLLMAVTMLWQMSLTPKSGDQAQQRIFMFVPLIFIFFCYNFASALALYWTAQNLFSIVQLYLTRDRTVPAPVKVTSGKGKKR